MTEHELHEVTGLGHQQHVPGETLRRKQAAFDETMRVAGLSGDHVWIALVQHHVQKPEEFVRAGILDSESVVGVQLGCYVCEEPYSDRLRLRRCPGEPKR